MNHDASTYIHAAGLGSIRIGENCIDAASRDGRKLYFTLASGADAAINCDSEEQAREILIMLQRMLGMQVREEAQVVPLRPEPPPGTGLRMHIGEPTVITQPPAEPAKTAQELFSGEGPDGAGD